MKFGIFGVFWSLFPNFSNGTAAYHQIKVSLNLFYVVSTHRGWAMIAREPSLLVRFGLCLATKNNLVSLGVSKTVKFVS